MSNNLWLGVKFVETSVENVLQLVLMTWLLVPYFACAPPKTLNDLIYEGIMGFLDILSFNYFDAGDLAVKCGKIVFAVISIASGYSLLRLKKPGLNFSRKMKSFLVLFPGALCQVVARLLSLWTLMLMEQSGMLKYTLFLVIHTTLCLLIKIFFELRAKDLKMFKVLLMLFISCISSTFVQNNIHHNSSTHINYPKFDIISRCLFLLVTFIENICLSLMPFMYPHLYNTMSEHYFGINVAVVSCLWVISMFTEVIN